jgi:hypothetical protein
MRGLSIGLMVLGIALLVVAGNTAASWKWTSASAPQAIQNDFKVNDASSQSAPQQQVTASWAIKDATILTATEVQLVSSRLETIALLLAAIVIVGAAGVVGLVGRPVAALVQAQVAAPVPPAQLD